MAALKTVGLRVVGVAVMLEGVRLWPDSAAGLPPSLWASLAFIAAGALIFYQGGRRPTGPVTTTTPAPLSARDQGVLPGPVSLSGLNVKMSIVYGEHDDPEVRPITLNGATGYRGADGAITLDEMQAYCHLHHRPCTFRVDRIVSTADGDGVVIPDLAAWVLAAAGNGGSEGTPAAAH